MVFVVEHIHRTTIYPSRPRPTNRMATLRHHHQVNPMAGRLIDDKLNSGQNVTIPAWHPAYYLAASQCAIKKPYLHDTGYKRDGVTVFQMYEVSKVAEGIRCKNINGQMKRAKGTKSSSVCVIL